MDRDRSTATHSGRRPSGGRRRESRHRVRRGATTARRRRRRSPTAPIRDARAGRPGEPGTTTPERGPSLQRATPAIARHGVDPPRGLAWLLALLARRGGPRDALTASRLLWLFVAVGWRVGVLDGAAVLWLSASVVVAFHLLGTAEQSHGRRSNREPSDGRRPADYLAGR